MALDRARRVKINLVHVFGPGHQEFITPYTPQQNGLVERFFRSLKEECIWLYNFDSPVHAAQEIEAWIEFYNAQRPHQALNYLSPDEFRAQFDLSSQAA